ncbi:MAG: right-handed parallel beta-helix repeat-containing protein, partial [Thermoplasmata archaeon]|nr:right-handed parallel beta-helix repeat-containing protein [Thermoplasmata archaeon]
FGVGLINNSSDREELVENALQWLIPQEVEEYYSFYLSPDYQQKTTTTGGTVVYEIEVVNNGTEDDTIDLVRSAPPSGWTAWLDRDIVDVGAGENTTVNLSVTAPANATNGEYANISVTGTSQGDPDLIDIVYTNTTVSNEPTDLEPIELGPVGGAMVLGEDTTINATVRNNGNRDANDVDVFFYLDDNASLPIGTDTIDVPAGEERNATIDWDATSSFGDHTLIVDVDRDNTEPETNESNNHLENATEDWIVKGSVQWGNAEYNLTGNLSVEGRFLLENVSIYFNSTHGKYGLDCMNSGVMGANNSEFGTLGNASDSSFRFEARGELTLTNSLLYRLYYNDDSNDPKGGIVVFSSSTLIKNTTITKSGMGLWTPVSPMIVNSSFENLTDYGLYSIAGSPRVTGSLFRNITTGIALVGGAGEIEGCDITDVSTGIFTARSSTALLTKNAIHGLRGLNRGFFISGSSPTLKGNTVHNTSTGVWIESDASPIITGNDLSDNRHNSVYSSESSPVFEGAIMSGNPDYGVRVSGGGMIIRHSTIADNGKN